jgi:hypothetical protein
MTTTEEKFEFTKQDFVNAVKDVAENFVYRETKYKQKKKLKKLIDNVNYDFPSVEYILAEAAENYILSSQQWIFESKRQYSKIQE